MGKFVVKFMDDFPMEKDWLHFGFSYLKGWKLHSLEKMDGKPAGKTW